MRQHTFLTRLAVGVIVMAGLLLQPAAARATVIGPDAFGYTATDEVSFSFVDISSTGTRVLANVDDLTTSAGLGFDLNFYGTTYNTVSWSPNGLLTFGGANSQFSNADLTTTAPSGNLPSIAVLWDDWRTTTSLGGDATYYQTLGAPGSRQFVVQWNEVIGFSSSPSSVTFEAILFEGSDEILFQYADVLAGNTKDNGGSSTVGIRNTNGQLNGQRLQWSFNSPVISNSEAIRFSRPTQSGPVIPEPGSLILMGLGLAGVGFRGGPGKKRV